MKQLLLIISTLILFNITAEDVTLSNILISAQESSNEWKLLNIKSKKTQLNIKINRLAFLPEWYIGDGSTPIYSGGESGELEFHSIGFVTGMNWWTPIDGTLSVTVSDTISFVESDDEFNINQSPTLSVSYNQPTSVGGYKKSRYLQLLYPHFKEQLNSTVEQNRLVLEVVQKLNSIKSKTRELLLKQEELKLLGTELEMLDIQREKGSVTGIEYWDKQLDREKLNESIWELERELTQLNKVFLESNGIELNGGILYPEIDDDLFTNSISNSHLLKLLELESEKSLMEISADRLNYTSNITASLSVTPQYGEREDLTDFNDSFDFTTEGSYIDYSFSLLYNFSSRTFSKQRLNRDYYQNQLLENRVEWNKSKQNIQSSYMEVQDRYNLLLDRKKRLEDSIEYVENLYEGEVVRNKNGNSSLYELSMSAYNLISRRDYLSNIEDEIFYTKLNLLSMEGFDLSTLLTEEE